MPLARLPLLALAAPLLLARPALAFCGFYVAKADAQIYNHASQVVIARDGDRTILTISNDFKGPLTEFAEVVPVPSVLHKEQVHIGERKLLERIDAYSAPRLVEYFDPDPCRPLMVHHAMASRRAKSAPSAAAREDLASSLGVKIEAEYTVGEYDIVILSAKQSTGLEQYLQEEGYQVPAKAAAALEPYVKQAMKFFVAKVNLTEQAKTGYTYLRPIQIAYEFEKFMLPIRLGMANAEGSQDLTVYTLTRKGRVESANYRTVELPSGMDVPVFVKDDFKDFYLSLFEKAYNKEDRKAVFTEYAWDGGWCDPCADPPLSADELRGLGVFWLDDQPQQPGPYSRGRRGGFRGTSGAPLVTRLHVRYNASDFPEDLVFQETGNRENYQARYVLRHTWRGASDCDAARDYRKGLKDRHEMEAETLARLTGWELSQIVGKMGDDAPDHTEFERRQQLVQRALEMRRGTTVRVATLAALSLLVFTAAQAKAFCGFYVAKADAQIYNHASQVVIARDGDREILTLSNDFKGPLTEFAEVVPVPTVLHQDQVHIGERKLVERIDAYSAPRLVEYFDPDPCNRPMPMPMLALKSAGAMGRGASSSREDVAKSFGVKIEAEYTVGEYDIVILSALQSNGLESYLKHEGYKLPDKAAAALEPYIKQEMKFFVAKVNLKEQAKTGFTYLRPIQIAFESPKFMLPIRLGMANSEGTQDLTIYTLTRNGRVEFDELSNRRAALGHGRARLRERRVQGLLPGHVRQVLRQGEPQGRLRRVRLERRRVRPVCRFAAVARGDAGPGSLLAKRNAAVATEPLLPRAPELRPRQRADGDAAPRPLRRRRLPRGPGLPGDRQPRQLPGALRAAPRLEGRVQLRRHGPVQAHPARPPPEGGGHAGESDGLGDVEDHRQDGRGLAGPQPARAAVRAAAASGARPARARETAGAY